MRKSSKNIFINSHYLHRRTSGLSRYACQIRNVFSQDDVREICKIDVSNKLLRYIFLVCAELFIPSFQLSLNKHSRHISPAFSVPIISGGGRSIVVWHDLAFLWYPKTYAWHERLYFKFNLYLLKRGNHKVIVPSGYVKNELIAQGICYERITIISPFSEIAEGENVKVEKGYFTDRSYFLHVSNNHPRKNLSCTVRGFLKSNAALTHDLVIVGNFELDANYRHENIKIIRDVTDVELENYYRNALALLLFSHDEGFGYPVVEAAQVGTMPLLSNLGSLSEFSNDGDVIVTQLQIKEKLDKFMLEKDFGYVAQVCSEIRTKYTRERFVKAWRKVLL